MATRRERVVIELEDGLTAGVLREAAAVAVLNRELDKLGRTSTGTKRDMDPLARETIPQTSKNSDAASRSIDKFSGRLSLLVAGLTAVGPAAVPIGAVAVPAVSTLASGLGFLAVGAGTTVLAFHGLGDALTKFNKAAAEPTATNIAAAQAALDKIGPSAQNFVLELHKLGPELVRLQQAAGSGLFPGLTVGIREAQDALPAVERIFHRVGTEMGDLSAQAGKSLGGREWAPFLEFIGDEAPHALAQMGHALGSVTHGLAELWMATEPLNSGGLDWIEHAAQGFDHWATGLDKTKGFQEFVAYIQQNGPEVERLLANTASLFVDVAEAAAPLGGPTLQALTLIVKLLDAIANSPLGTPLLLLLQVNSVLKLTGLGLKAVGVEAKIGFGGVTTQATNSTKALSGLRAEARAAGAALQTIGGNARRYSSSGTLLMTGVSKEGLASLAKGAALAGGMTLAMSGADQQMGLTNTTSLALAGSLAGPLGAGVGGAVGLALDWQAALKKDRDEAEALTASVMALASAGDLIGLGKMADSAQQVADFANDKGGIFSGLAEKVQPPIAAFDTLSASVLQFNSDLTGTDSPIFSMTKMQQVASRMQPAMARLGITFDDMLNMDPEKLKETVDHLAHMTAVADSAQGRSHAMAKALAELGDESLTSADRVKALEDALDGLFSPKMNLNAAHNAWHEALNGLAGALSDTESLKSAQINAHSAQIAYNDAVKQYGKRSDRAALASERLVLAQQKLKDASAGSSRAILGNSDAALKNQDTIRGLADQLVGYLKAQSEAGKPASQIMATYRTQRQALIDTAAQLGINKHDLLDYLKVIGFTPKAVSTKLELQGLDAAERNLQHLTRDRVIHITARVDHLGVQDTTATGGHVLTGHADGGTVGGAPRRPYGDKVIIAAAPGEEIITNRHGEADKFRADRASGRIPAYADGGEVRARSFQRAELPDPALRSGWSQRAPEIDYARLTRALLAARPMYGDVKISGDPTVFHREMMQDRQRAALGSVAPR